MAITWDAGTAITGEGSVTPGAQYARVYLDTVPAWFSQSADSPPRYYSLGIVGGLDGDYRSNGIRLHYVHQELIVDMLAPPSLYWVLEDGVSGTLYRGVSDVLDQPVICWVYNSAAQTAANNAITTVTFDSEVEDDWAMHSPTTNPTRVTCVVPGWYHIIGRVGFPANANGQRSLSIVKNGTGYYGQVTPTPNVGGTSPLIAEASTLLELAVGDYVELQVSQNSGGGLALQINAPSYSALQLMKVA